MKKQLFSLASSFILLFSAQSYVSAQGTWTELTNAAPNNSMGVMLLLTDGTVIVKDDGGSGTYGSGWNRLTPDNTGSYANGTWTSIANMNNDRLFFATQVLPNGKVFAAGGEYSSGSGSTSGEVYDPIANTWTNTNAVYGGENIYDGNSEILASGVVLVGPQNAGNHGKDNIFYSNTTNSWTLAPNSPLDHDEAAWLKLPDGSILFVGINSTQSCRYIPSTNTWVADANLPVSIYDQYGEEAGGAYMLPNGKAIFFGATTHNAIYTPSGTSSPGTWTAAADYPTISGTTVGEVDAAGAMMVNGKILLAVSPSNTSSNDQFRYPFWFLEYDYTTNTFAQVTSVIPGVGADSVAGVPCNFSNFLMLPNGQVLFGISEVGNNIYWVYTPSGSPIPQGKPTINSIYQTACGTYKARGKLFNGISEGAGFGDDWQMETNYPIIRLTNGTNTYYARTTNWNRVGAVQTDSLEDTVQFTIPSLPAGTYSLVVTANGFASNPVLFTPYGATASATTNITCHGLANGNATATVSGGNSPYTYKWSNASSTVSTSSPTGPILSAGTYTLTVTDKLGCTTTSTVTITQPLAISVTPHITNNVSCNGGSNGLASVTVSGGTSPYTYAWTGGGTNSSKSTLSSGSYTITVTDKNGCSQTTSVSITQPTAVAVTSGVTANVKCHGSNTGSASASASGGTAPYTYSWTGGGTNSTKTGLTAGTFTITVTDKNGCTGTAKATVTQPAALSLVQGSKATAWPVNCSGTAWVTASGGVSPYKYSWSPGGETTDTIKGQCAGSYCCTVTDKNGCIDSVCVSVVTGIQSITNSSSFNIYPNPNNGTFFMESAVVLDKSTIEIDNVLGQQVIKTQISGTKNEMNLSAQPSGVYFYSVFDKTGKLLGNGKIVVQK